MSSASPGGEEGFVGDSPAANQLDTSTGMADNKCSTNGIYRECSPSAYIQRDDPKHWVAPLSMSLKQKYMPSVVENERGMTTDEMKMYNIVVNVHCTLPIDSDSPKVYARMQYFFKDNRARVRTITSPPLVPCGDRTLSATFKGEAVKKMLTILWVELFLDDRDDPSGEGVCAVGEKGQDQQCTSADGRCNGDGWSASNGTSASVCPSTSCFDSSNNYCTAGPQRGGAGAFYESSAEEALLVEAVTITREHKDIPQCTVPSIEDGGSITNSRGDDRDASRSVFVCQMVPFALYAPKNTIDPSCGIRHDNIKTLSTERPTNVIFRMSTTPSAGEAASVTDDQTRVFRGTLILKGDADKYPDKLRMCFFAHSDTDNFNAEAVLQTMRPQFTQSTEHLAKRVCCVDLDLVKSIASVNMKGNGQIVNFHIALQAKMDDSVKMIAYSEGNSGGSLNDATLQLTSLNSSESNSTVKNIDQPFRYTEEILVLARQEAFQLCKSIRPAAPVRKGSALIDLEYLRRINTNPQAKTLDVPGTIASGRGILVSGQFICETSGPAQELVSTTVRMGPYVFALSLTRTTLSATFSQEGKRDLVRSLQTPRNHPIRAATEVMYACALFRDGGVNNDVDVDTLMLMLSAGEKTVSPMKITLNWPNTLHYPPITGLMYAPSSDVRMISSRVATSIVGVPSADLMHDRVTQFTQRRDVRAFASPLLTSRGSFWGSVATPLTQAVNMRHMSFTLVLHTWLLKNTHYVTEGCEKAGWGYPPVAFQDTNGKKELVIAEWGGMQVVLQLTNRDESCKHSDRVLLLRPHRDVNNEGDILLVDSTHLNAHHTEDKNTMGMLQVLITHTGNSGTGNNGSFRGHVCVRLTNTWGWSWGVRTAQQLRSAEDNVRSTVCTHVNLNTFCTVYCLVDGYALPLDCDGKANIQYPHDNYATLEDETTALTQKWFNQVRSVTVGPQTDQVDLRVTA